MNPISRDELATLLVDARIKPRLRRELRFVPEEITDWENRDFLTVTNKNGTEGVLIMSSELPSVMPFRLQKRTANKMGRIEAIICDICATWQSGSRSAVITFPRENSSVSFLVCAGLSCSLHVRDKTDQAKLSRTQLRENNTIEQRIERLNNRLHAIIASLKK